jgi:hypothetical protein
VRGLARPRRRRSEHDSRPPARVRGRHERGNRARARERLSGAFAEGGDGPVEVDTVGEVATVTVPGRASTTLASFVLALPSRGAVTASFGRHHTILLVPSSYSNAMASARSAIGTDPHVYRGDLATPCVVGGKALAKHRHGGRHQERLRGNLDRFGAPTPERSCLSGAAGRLLARVARPSLAASGAPSGATRGAALSTAPAWPIPATPRALNGRVPRLL